MLTSVLIGKPRWFICASEGVVFGVLVALLGLLQRNTWSQIVLGGLFGGLLFGVVLGFRTATAFARMLDAAGARGAVNDDQRLTAVKIAVRKQSPTERPMVMRAAYRVAVFRHDQAVRQYRLTLIVFGVLLVVSVLATIAFSIAFTLLALICLVSLLVWLRRPRRLQQRVEALTPVTPGPSRGRRKKG